MKKPLLLTLLIASILLNSFAQPVSKTSNPHEQDVPDGWGEKARAVLEKASFGFKTVSGKEIAANKNQHIQFETNGKSFFVRPFETTPGFSFASISLSNVGRGNYKIAETQPALLRKENYLLYDYSSYAVEYISDGRGVRQNFIIKQKPAGDGSLDLKFSVSGDLEPSIEANRTLVFKNRLNGNSSLRYDDLAVWDAKKNKLSAVMIMSGDDEISIQVDDRNAVYPITVDPLTHAPEWTGSADGVLPALLTTLQLQVEAMYGYEVSGLGDVNGDGFDDAAISAPGAIDVIAGPTVVAGAGAVFIYFGSASGLSTTPDRVLRSNVPVANALFGYSVSSGNVIGDNKKDIIIGAPGESYSANVNGFPVTANVTAGKVYVFNGQDIANNSINVPKSLFLNGSIYFSNGVAGVGANVTVNALFGFSVAAAGDMDGDGLGEVVVGAPGYADAAVLTVRTGAAFIYSSAAIISNNPTRLSGPTLLQLPGLVNLNGLLFGFSVDGAGDYNRDNIDDVVIGAPGGLNLGVAGFLGGSAYVFAGTGTTTYNTSFITRLSSGGVINSIANLFGFCVKGLTNATGVRNGNIIISSPVSNVLSNIVGGLQLKSGLLNVFIGTSSPGNTRTPDQQLTSPRTTSLLGILAGQNIDASLLTGASIDNLYDANCDGYGDIVVGEPLSTGVGLINANAVGGAAFVFTGKPDGTFNSAPYWTLEITGFDFGVNAGSMLGYSVAGLGHVTGSSNGIKMAVGAPGAALDYSAGIFNLGNTLNVTSDFLAANNGMGKSYVYNFQNCSVVNVHLAAFNVTNDDCQALLSWQTGVADNISHTVVEQSSDGSAFTPVQTVGRISGGIYSIHISQEMKIGFYRLKMVQTDGTVFTSDVKKLSLSCGKDESIEAYPTLFTDDIKIVFNTTAAKGNSILTVSDIYGRSLLAKQLNVANGINQVIINGANFPKGMYYVRITGKNFKSETVKIVKD